MEEARALSKLAFDELAGAVGGIGGVHRAIADRAFGLTGVRARPAKLAHDVIAGGVYAAVCGATLAAGRSADVALRQCGAAPPLSTTPRGGAVLGVVNGLRGDALEREASPLAQAMAIRVDGRVVAPERGALAAAFPAAARRIVVFVHGLMETEHAWRRGGRDWYGARLERDVGCTAIDVRYNAGRHISENGRSLAQLVDRVVAEWPVEVEEIALVGHSMGGLVARSACHVATLEAGPRDEPGMAWVRRVRHVVSLGSPHLGAPLEQAVHAAAAALHAAPETRPFSRFLRRRSAGIRDLHGGSLVDEDWRDRDSDQLRRAACQEVPLLEGAAHCFVAATVTQSPRHPVGRLVGDLLVLEPSASGRGRARRIPFRAEHGMLLGGTHHLGLLNHPAVYDQLRDWLATTPASGEAP